MKSSFAFLLSFLLLIVPLNAAPQRSRLGRLRGGQTGGQTAATGGRGAQGGATGGQTANGATPGVNAAFDGTPVGTIQTDTATDGSTIFDKTVMIKYSFFPL